MTAVFEHSLRCFRAPIKTIAKNGRNNKSGSVFCLRWARAFSHLEAMMTANGLDVFDKTIQTTNIWLKEIMDDLGPDRQLAWHTLGVVLRTLRDRLPPDLGANLAAELPLLIRGAYYDQYNPSDRPSRDRSIDEFLDPVADGLKAARPIDPGDAARAVFKTLVHHIDLGQSAKVRDALPGDVQTLWPGSVGA